MKYNPRIHHRRSMRLSGYDYSQERIYFITINTRNRINFFGEIRNGIMCLNNTGTIAHKYWLEIPDHFPNVRLGNHIIMPDHMHGIIRLFDELHTTRVQSEVLENFKPDVSALHATRLHQNHHMSNISPKIGSVSTIIRSYKSAVSKSVHQIDPVFEWQPNYYDQIIRGKISYDNISHYIAMNPLNWKQKSLYSLLLNTDEF